LRNLEEAYHTTLADAIGCVKQRDILQSRIDKMETDLACYRASMNIADQVWVMEHEKVIALQKKCADEQVKLKELENTTYCAYCGERFALDDKAATFVTKHIHTCPDHPMRAIEAELDALQSEKESLEDAIAIYKNSIKDCKQKRDELQTNLDKAEAELKIARENTEDVVSILGEYERENTALRIKLGIASDNIFDLANEVDRLDDYRNTIQAKYDALQIRLTAAESGSLEQAEEYMELQRAYNERITMWEDAIAKLEKADEEICRLERYNGK
jgi:chromosome segregation ATPase